MLHLTKKSPPLKLGIIIPCFNEQENIAEMLDQPEIHQAEKVIVIDGGSTDNTLSILKNHAHQIEIIHHPHAQRGAQMNAAAAQADTDILLFLHADTLLPEGALTMVRNALANNTDVGCFRRVFTPRTALLDFTSELAYWRSRLFFWSYGDQAIFIRKETFDALGGYREISMLEDLDLCLRAKKKHLHCVIDSAIQTSARRFTDAPLKRLLKDAALSFGFTLGLYRPDK